MLDCEHVRPKMRGDAFPADVCYSLSSAGPGPLAFELGWTLVCFFGPQPHQSPDPP